MKLMFCQECGSLVVPGEDMEAKWCNCGRHAVWWRDGRRGLISFYDKRHVDYPGYQQRAYLIGINNALLRADEIFDAKAYRELAAACGPSYLFHTYESNIVRAKPGNTNDSRWETSLPGQASGE
jgi:hypothetical protein